jgi:hypothetical protein
MGNALEFADPPDWLGGDFEVHVTASFTITHE